MIFDKYRREATPGARSECPLCGGVLIAKCGQIVVHHWAHVAADCDPWAEPESEWHRAWKRRFLARGDRVEVVMGPHRADVVTLKGRIIELQSSYQSADKIEKREQFYGANLVWIYRCTWEESLHWGEKGFWWKHGAKSMTRHQRPIWWDMGDGWLMEVRLALIDKRVEVWEGHYETESQRVIGKVMRHFNALDLFNTTDQLVLFNGHNQGDTFKGAA